MDHDSVELDAYQMEEIQRGMWERLMKGNENTATSGGAQYVRGNVDTFKTSMKKYVPGPGKSIYTYTRQLETHFADKGIDKPEDRIEILKDRLSTDDRTLANDWQVNPEDVRSGYKQFVHFLAVTIDSMTASRQLVEIEKLRQKPNEHIRKYLVTFREAWNVYERILQDEENVETRPAQFLRAFAQGCQEDEKKLITGKMLHKKIQTIPDLTTYISKNLPLFAHIPSNRTPQTPSMDYKSIYSMIKSAIQSEFHKVNTMT